MGRLILGEPETAVDGQKLEGKKKQDLAGQGWLLGWGRKKQYSAGECGFQAAGAGVFANGIAGLAGTGAMMKREQDGAEAAASRQTQVRRWCTES